MVPQPQQKQQFKGYICKEAKAELVLEDFQPKPLADDQVDIRVTHNGICHSDLHVIDNDYGLGTYPFIPGHEVVGEIAAVGKNVTNWKVGQRAGVGWMRDSCGNCRNCIGGQENVCIKGNEGVILNGNYGGYANYIRLPAKMAFPIPDGLDSESVGPLLCGGITVYAPLRKYLKHPGMRVAVVGIGGLGHMAIRFAHAMGAEVVAISTSKSKEKEAINEHGADKFVISQDAEKELGMSVDLIINTVSAKSDLGSLVKLLAPNGTLCVVGLSDSEVTCPAVELLMYQRSVCGSIIGGRADTLEMLQFAAAKGIKPMVELMKLSQINEALERLKKNQARYRIVLETDIQ